MALKKNDIEISDEDKNVFLQDLEEEGIEEEYEYEDDDRYEEEERKRRKKKKSYSVAIFASIFVFFIFIVVLLIFLLSLADTDNPVFRAFGIEGYQIKNFLQGLANKIFMGVVIVLLLVSAVGIFRGYSLPKDNPKKRRASFVFGWVSMGLVFFSILAWGGVMAFINKFVVSDYSKAQIEIVNAPDGKILAPIDLQFSAVDIRKEVLYKGDIIKGFRWSKDGGRVYSSSSLNPYYTFQYFSDGVQTIELEVELLSGKILDYERVFLIDEATFVTRPGRIEQGRQFVIDASGLQKDGGVFIWDFDGDGIPERRTNTAVIKRLYETKGEKTIKLRVEADNGGVKEYSKTIIVYPEGDKKVNAKIFVDETIGKAPFKVTFDGSASYSEFEKIVKYTWQIEGKRPQEGDVIDYTFKKAGKYDVLLTVFTESGQKDSEKILIDVEKGNSAPIAELVTKPASGKGDGSLIGYVPFLVNFYGGKSTDAEENIVQYRWKLEEGGDVIEEFFSEKQEYIFRSPGVYSMKLRVSDAGGEFSEKVVKVVVKEPPVIPVVSAFPSSGTAPLVVEFNASLSTCRLDDCRIISYEWDYDDKTKVVRGGAFTSHEFKKPGTYEVEVTAITDTGEKVAKTLYVTVTDTPLVSCFSASRTEGVAPLTVSFDPTRCSRGDIVRYKWDFGDGYISSKKKTVHTYTNDGVYSVVLRVFDKDGRVNEMKEVITVSNRNN